MGSFRRFFYFHAKREEVKINTTHMGLKQWERTEPWKVDDFNVALQRIEEDFSYRGINPVWYGADPTGVSDSTEAFKKAIEALPAHGGRIIVPGRFKVNGLELKRSNITFSGNNAEESVVFRSENKPIFYANGVPYPTQTGGLPSIVAINFEDIKFSSQGDFEEDLLQFQGCSNIVHFRCKFDAKNCSLVFWNQVWDSRFIQCIFYHGGNSDGTKGALTLAGGLSGYKHTMEVQLNNCWFEGYYGPAIMTPRQVPWKTSAIQMSNIKFESKNCNGPHWDLEIQDLQLNNVYISTEITSGDVVRFRNTRGILGSIRFYVINQSIVPTSLIYFDSSCRFIDLNVQVSEPQPANLNVVTLPYDDPSINLDIVAVNPYINGRYSKLKSFFNTVLRQVGTATDSVRYAFAKSGRPEWSIGDPTTDGTNEDFYIRADNVNFMTLRSRGRSVESSYREIIPNAYLHVGSNWSSTSLLRMNNYTFWVDSKGIPRYKNGLPTSDFDGFPLEAKPLQSISEAPSFVGQIAVVNGIGYLAVGTSSTADWKRTTE